MSAPPKDSLVLLLFYKRTLLFRYPDDESNLQPTGDATKVVPFLSQRTLDAFVIEPASGLDNAYSTDSASSSSSLSFTSETSSETFSHPSSLAASGHSSAATSQTEPVLTPTVQPAPAPRPVAPLRIAEKVMLNPALARRQRQAGKKREDTVEATPPPPQPIQDDPTDVASPTSIGSPTNNGAAAWLASKKRASLGFPDSSLGYVVSAGLDGDPSTDCLTLSLGGEQMLVLPIHMADTGDADPAARAKESSSLRLVAAVRSRGREGSIVGFLRCVVRAMEREEEVCGFLSKEVSVLADAMQQLSDTKSILVPPEQGEGMYSYIARTTGSVLCQELCAISAAVSASHEEGSLGAVPSVLINRALKVPTRLLYDEKSLTPEERTALLRQRHRQVLASVREGCPGEWHLVVQVSFEELLDRLSPLYDALMGATGVATLPLPKVAMVTVGGLGPPPHSVHQLRTQLRGCITSEGATQVLIDSSDMDYFVAQVVELLYTLDCIALLRPEIQLTLAALCPLQAVNPTCLQPTKIIHRTLRGCSGSCVLGDFCVVCQFLLQSDSVLGRGGMSMDSTPPPLQYGRLFNLLLQSHGGGHWYERSDQAAEGGRIPNLFIVAAKGGTISPEDVAHLRRFRAAARMYFPSMAQRVAACFRPSTIQPDSLFHFQERCIPYSLALEVTAMGLCMTLWDGAAHPLLVLVSHIQALLGALRRALKRLDRIINVLFPRAMEDVDVVLGNDAAREILKGRGLDPLGVRHAALLAKNTVIDRLLATGECGDWRTAIRLGLLASQDVEELATFLPSCKTEDAIESIANLQFVITGLGIPFSRLRRYVKCRVFPVVGLYPPQTSIMRQEAEDVGASSGESDPRGYTLLLIHHAINLFSDAAFVSYHSVTRSWV